MAPYLPTQRGDNVGRLSGEPASFGWNPWPLEREWARVASPAPAVAPALSASHATSASAAQTVAAAQALPAAAPRVAFVA